MNLYRGLTIRGERSALNVEDRIISSIKVNIRVIGNALNATIERIERIK